MSTKPVRAKRLFCGAPCRLQETLVKQPLSATVIRGWASKDAAVLELAMLLGSPRSMELEGSLGLSSVHCVG